MKNLLLDSMWSEAVEQTVEGAETMFKHEQVRMVLKSYREEEEEVCVQY